MKFLPPKKKSFFILRKKIKTFFLVTIFLATVFSCGSDRKGDEIGALKTTNYPENYNARATEFLFMKDVTGPDSKSEFPQRIATSWKKYSTGAKSRLCILLTDTNCTWLGLVHGLKTIGVPFMVTTDYREALQHKVVIAYPIISGAAIPPENIQALVAYPRNGGTLIGVNVLGALNEVFGFVDAVPSKQHFEISMTSDSSDLTKEFTDPMEQRISIGNKLKYKETIGTYSYSKTLLPPLAVYEDKSAAISQRFYAGGKAFAFGFDIGYIIMKAHNVRHEEFNRSSINDFEPTVDVLLRLIKNIYLSSCKDACTIQTVPYNKNLSVVVTHNIDFRNAFDNCISNVREEKALGIHSTYFIQTKYIRDMHDFIFKEENDFMKLNRLAAIGMDLASNTVSGSPLFDQFPQGTGIEKYPAYLPYVMAYDKTYHGTIYGELRVSKFLIEHSVPNYNVGSFRSTYLYAPFTYPQSLYACGYHYSSCFAANATLSHFPLQTNYNREYDSETDIFEFPVTDDDEFPPYSLDRLQSSLKLAKRIARYGGCFVGQVHPNAMGLSIEKSFYEKLKNDAWFGSLKDFGDWWVARNQISLDVILEGGRRVVVLNVPRRMEGLAVMLPIRSTPIAVYGGGKYSVDGKLIIFEIAEGVIKVTLDN